MINIGSIASSSTPPMSVVYSATSKSAVDAVTRVLAKELGSRRIRVNSINPSGIETEGTRASWDHGGRFQKATGGANAARTCGATGGHRVHCGFSGFPGFRMAYR